MPVDAMDFVGRFENFKDDFNLVAKELGIGNPSLPHKNSSKHQIYREYYSEYTRSTVAYLYKPDIECFQYSF